MLQTGFWPHLLRSVGYFFPVGMSIFAHVPVRSLGSHWYLTCVTAAELKLHQSSIHAIWDTCMYNKWDQNGTAEINWRGIRCKLWPILRIHCIAVSWASWRLKSPASWAPSQYKDRLFTGKTVFILRQALESFQVWDSRVKDKTDMRLSYL